MTVEVHNEFCRVVGLPNRKRNYNSLYGEDDLSLCDIENEPHTLRKRTRKQITTAKEGSVRHPFLKQSQVAVTINLNPWAGHCPTRPDGTKDPGSNELWAKYESDLSILKPGRGMIALYRVNERGHRDYTPHDLAGTPLTHVFPFMNGVRKDEEIGVLGVFTNAQNTHQQGRMTEGAITFAGSDSIVNTGPEQIHAGERIYVDPYPTAYEDENGELRACVHIRGTDPRAMPPSTVGARGYRDNHNLAMKWRNQLFRIFHEDPNCKNDNYDFIGSVGFRKFMQDLGLEGRIDSPHWWLAVLVACEVMVMEQDNSQIAMEAVEKIFRKRFEDVHDKRKRYLKSLDLSDQYGQNTFVPFYSRVTTLGEWWAKFGPSAPGYEATSFRQVTKTVLQRVMQEQHKLVDECAIYIERLYVGLCVSGAAPGGQLDVLVRHN